MSSVRVVLYAPGAPGIPPVRRAVAEIRHEHPAESDGADDNRIDGSFRVA
jgi:hypothetical protein